MSDWREGLTHKDWLFDGSPIRSEAMIDRFNHLDWSNAWVDMGPSIAGNLGPYWHVPMDDGDTVHRLYPKVLLSKWLMLIREACKDYAGRQVERAASPIVMSEVDIAALNEWIREPDYAEDFSLEKMADWINRRPIAMVARVLAGSAVSRPECKT